MDDLFDLTEIGGDIEIEGLGELSDLRFRLAHFQLGVVLLNLLANLGKLAGGVFDLLQAVAVRLIVQLELGLILFQFRLRLLHFERELGGGLAIPRLQIRLHFGFQVDGMFLRVDDLK